MLESTNWKEWEWISFQQVHQKWNTSPANKERKQKTTLSPPLPVFPLKEEVSSLGYIVWCQFPISSEGKKSIWLYMFHILNYILFINILFAFHSKPFVFWEKIVSYQIQRVFSSLNLSLFFFFLPSICTLHFASYTL